MSEKFLKKIINYINENYPLTGAPKTDRWLRKTGEKGDWRFASKSNQRKDKAWSIEENDEEDEEEITEFVENIIRQYTKYY